MATRVKATQSLQEIRTHFVDFTPDLPEGVTVLSVAATHTPPSGAASTPTVITSLSPVIMVTIGPLAVKGTHYLSVLATLSNGDRSEILIDIVISY